MDLNTHVRIPGMPLARLLVVVLALGLSACEQDMSDLEQRVATAKQRPGGLPDPIPPTVTYQSYPYQVQAERSPFLAEIRIPPSALGQAGDGPTPDPDLIFHHVRSHPKPTQLRSILSS